MNRILIIGAGGVGQTAARKCAQYGDDFSAICLASRTKSKCDLVRSDLSSHLTTADVDADDVASVVNLIDSFGADLVLNAALPPQNLPIMDACLQTGTHYVDTSAPEPDPSKYEIFCYKWQTDYHDRFVDRGIMALLSFGFDPGVTNLYCAYAAKHLYDEIHSVDILDCNGGSHGHPFATNFNPVTNILEVTQKGIYWQDGKWCEIEPFSIHRSFDFQQIGPREMYVIYHEEMETLVTRLPHLREMRFWMHFSEEYLTHLEVLQNVGLTSMEAVEFEGRQIRPLEFLRQVLPDPASLGSRYSGRTNIGCLFHGVKDGEAKNYYIYNVCEHAKCYEEVKSQAISYTTAVPAVTGARLILNGTLMKPGVYLPEDLDPDPLMDALPDAGLPWHIEDSPQMECHPV